MAILGRTDMDSRSLANQRLRSAQSMKNLQQQAEMQKQADIVKQQGSKGSMLGTGLGLLGAIGATMISGGVGLPAAIGALTTGTGAATAGLAAGLGSYMGQRGVGGSVGKLLGKGKHRLGGTQARAAAEKLESMAEQAQYGKGGVGQFAMDAKDRYGSSVSDLNAAAQTQGLSRAWQVGSTLASAGKLEDVKDWKGLFQKWKEGMSK